MFLVLFVGAVTLEVYNTFHHDNYGNYIFKADSQCDRYILYVKNTAIFIQFYMISGETIPFNADFFNNRKGIILVRLFLIFT